MLNLVHICSLILVTILSVINELVYLYWIQIILAIFLSVLTVILIFKTSGFIRISYTIFLLAGVALSVINHIPLISFIESYNANAIFVALFVCIPFIRMPIFEGNYLEKIIPMVKSIPDNYLRTFMVSVTFSICSFLNIAGMRVVRYFFDERMNANPKAYGKVLSRSQSLGAFWSPYFSAYAVAVAYSNGNPGLILATGLFFCITIIAVWSTDTLMKRKPMHTINFQKSKETLNELKGIFLFFSLLVTFVILLSHVTDISIIIIISLLSVSFSIIWLMLMKNRNSLIDAFKNYLLNDLPNIKEEAFLFISIGLFSNTLMELGWKLQLPNAGFDSHLMIALFIIFFNLIVIFFALIGVHHLVMITLLTTSFHWQALPISPTVYGMTILLSWGLCSMLSPFSPVNLLAGKITGRSSIQVSILSNWRFAVLVLIGGSLYLTGMNYLLEL